MMWKNEIALQNLFNQRNGTQHSDYTCERYKQDEAKPRSYEGFPYVVLTRSDYYFLSEVEEWCEGKFGLKYGECDKNICPDSDPDDRDMNESFINFIHQAIHHNNIQIPYYCSINRSIIKQLCKTEEQLKGLEILPSNYAPSQGGFMIFELSRNKVECNIVAFVEFLKTLSEDEIADLINDTCEFYDLVSYEHSHKGNWKTAWITKSGYDAGYQDFAFKNSYDAMLFKLTWGDRL